MNINSNPKKFWSLITLVSTIILGATVYVTSMPSATYDTTTRTLFPIGTSTPINYSVGLVSVRDLGGTPVAYSGQAGSHYQIYWDAVQLNMTATPDWDSVKTRVSAIETRSIDPWLSVAIYEDSGAASAAVATDSLHVPTGVPTVLYGTGNCADRAPNYASGTFRNAYAKMVKSLVAEFDTRVAGYLIEMGVDGETTSVKDNASCPSSQADFEKKVSCTMYKEWIEFAMKTWRTYTTKALYIQGVTPMCSSANLGSNQFWNSARYIMEYSYPATATPGVSNETNPDLTPTPLYIGYKASSLAPDRTDAWNYEMMSPWGVLQAGNKYTSLGGSAFEPGLAPTLIPTAERIGYANYMAYASIANGATNLFFQPEWIPYIDSTTMYAITMTTGTTASDSPAVWIVPRSAEHQRSGSYDYSKSGYPGDFEHLASIISAVTPTPYCQPNTYATAQASGTGDYKNNPVICSAQITPVAPESRNTLFWPASSSIGINIDDTWYKGASWTGGDNYTAKITYLDSGTDTWSLVYSTGGTTYITETITKANSGAWVTEDIALSNAAFSNYMPTGGDFELRTGTGGEFFHRIFLEWNGGTVPTSTPTRTPTRTPTPRFTSTPTGVFSTPTKTPTPVATNSLVYGPEASAQENLGSETTTLRKDNPNTNLNGGYNEYALWENTGVTRSILMKFPALAKPSGYTHAGIVSATLTLNYTIIPGDDAVKIRIYQLTRDWRVAGATWNSTGLSSDSSDNWTSPGGFSSQDTNSDYVWAVMNPGANVIDITKIARRWLDGTDPNYGVVIIPEYTCTFSSATCTSGVGIAGDRYQQLSMRPSLQIWSGLSDVPTATPVATNTATPQNTPTPTTTPPSATPTPTSGGPTATATPTPLSGLKLNEVCLDPTTDANLDGSISIDDRAIELYNPGTQVIDLRDYRLEFVGSPSNTTQDTETNTYILPRNSYIKAGGYKVIYGEFLKNTAGESFNMPGSVFNTHIAFRDPDGILLTELTVSWPGDGLCWAQYPNGSGTWVTSRSPTLGRVN